MNSIEIREEGVLLDSFDELQVYDVINNIKVDASEGFVYMQYIYLGRWRTHYTFRAVNRDSKGFLTLGPVAIMWDAFDHQHRPRFRNDGYELYMLDGNPNNLLSFNSREQMQQTAICMDKLSRYNVLSIIDRLVEEEKEPWSIELPLEPISLEYVCKWHHAYVPEQVSNVVYQHCL